MSIAWCVVSHNRVDVRFGDEPRNSGSISVSFDLDDAGDDANAYSEPRVEALSVIFQWADNNNVDSVAVLDAAGGSDTWEQWQFGDPDANPEVGPVGPRWCSVPTENLSQPS